MKYFKRREFACNCGCGFNHVNRKLLKVLQDVRAHFNSELYITSACRCEWWNKEEGGSTNSYHLKGKAADFWIKDVSTTKVVAYLESKYSHTYGIGRYNGRTHIDIRKNKARWDSRA